MSVGLVNAIIAGLRYNEVPVILEPGYMTRGNGYVFPSGKPVGGLIHHTGSDYDTGLQVLLHGRPDLDPPLCNSCGHADGTIRIIAAHPANHAGASGGKSMGPLPVTRLFNREVWGHEIMYPGTRPMTAAQERSALILSGVLLGVLGHTSVEYIRLHHETSITGKWDAGAGIGAGKPLSGSLFRSRIWGALKSKSALIAPVESGVGDMPAGTVAIGADPETFELCMPVGKTSGLVHTGWLGVSLSQPGRISAEAYGGDGVLMDRWTATVGPHRRLWHELPDGAESYSVTVSTRIPGSAGWCLELRPRKDIAR